MRKLGREAHAIEAPFEPEAGAYAGGHHQHDEMGHGARRFMDHHHDEHGASAAMITSIATHPHHAAPTK